MRAKTDGQVLVPLVFNHNKITGAWMADHTRLAFAEVFEGYKGEDHLQMANSLRYQIVHNIVGSMPVSFRQRLKGSPFAALRKLGGI